MVKIRLRRIGAKRQPSYRLVVIDSRSPRSGRFIENIGFYNPRTEPETAVVDEGRALYWLSVGAQPTEGAARLLKNHGTLARFERLRKGESLETLAAEAKEMPAVAISPKTRREPAAIAAKPTAESSQAADEVVTEPIAVGEEGEA